LAPEATNVRAKFIAQQAERIVQRTNCTLATARHLIECQCARVLRPDIVLPFDDAELEGTTVGDVLADPDHFVDATLADSLEGPEYVRCIAKMMRRPDGSVWIHSFAHGRTVRWHAHGAGSP
jgi:hypothetical protein